MQSLMEPLFDVIYLGLVIALGVRLLLEKDKMAKRYGIMAIILGFGDAFHLVPRIVSNLTVNGFDKYVFYLSWGEFITSITMTIFYVLFYFYYRDISNDKDNNKKIIIYGLAILRIILSVLPQNLWGTIGSYTFGIIRNIPFAIMGLLLILWTYKFRNKEGLKNTSILIFLSFLFYLPVVLGARFIPTLGLFMIPKTIAYVLLVFVGYKHFIDNLKKEHLYKLSITFLIMGFIGGVFYREFTKAFSYSIRTTLSLVHVHLLVLGFIFFLVLYVISKWWNSDLTIIRKPIGYYVAGIVITVASFIVRGIYTITSNGQGLFNSAALSGIAGLGHIILSVSLVIILLNIMKVEDTENKREQQI